MEPTLANVDTQSEFNFQENKAEEGFTKWVVGRQLLAQELARRIHLPIGHQVEVWLQGGIRLRGKLRLKEELLCIEEERVRHLELVCDSVLFFYREMESCIRLD